MAKSFKRSACVPLLLAGSLQLAACDQRPTLLRDLYASQSDCQNDWGGGQDQCVRDGTPGGGVGWYGPQYYYGDRQARTGGRDSRYGVQDVYRGDIVRGPVGSERRGFGSTGRSFSSSGS